MRWEGPLRLPDIARDAIEKSSLPGTGRDLTVLPPPTTKLRLTEKIENFGFDQKIKKEIERPKLT